MEEQKMIVMTPKQFETSQGILKSIQDGWIKKTIERITTKHSENDVPFDINDVGVNIEFHEGNTSFTIEFVVAIDAIDHKDREFTEHLIFELDHNGNILEILKK